MGIYAINGIKIFTEERGRVKKFWIAVAQMESRGVSVSYVARNISEEKVLNTILWKIINKEVSKNTSFTLKTITSMEKRK